ncbi:VanZ family protein [Caldicellulosiruptor saccharolyticus DSM 8903]|uniref:VanZ family protein n=1 Tax=Caldicellulosiruptor saccharolyticus (strain ATCC 43494 / DSM 8903 / Tp8T 6331) TaxID=351627 RepID=A4XHS1_CALS8|nr:VanZ family protein [Caldicellulosiruptor saccharolyticus]ABP66456.2 VanZ family protein [Caldicellulosiruptor saccharolyticus DSM 8903]
MKLKEILKNAFIVICSLVLSIFLCYYVLDDIWLHFSIEAFSFIFLRVFVAILLFSLLHLIFNGKLYYFMLDILFTSYIVLVISLSFFRISRSEHYINFNLNEIINYSLSQIIENFILYLPAGFYLSFRIKNKPKITIFIFLVWIIVVELLQFLTKRGVFDILDIIINLLGYLTGILIFNIPQIKNFLITKKDQLN